jgi:hypothetical protein
MTQVLDRSRSPATAPTAAPRWISGGIGALHTRDQCQSGLSAPAGPRESDQPLLFDDFGELVEVSFTANEACERHWQPAHSYRPRGSASRVVGGDEFPYLFRPLDASQDPPSAIEHAGALGQPISHQPRSHARHQRLTSSRQGPQSRRSVDRRAVPVTVPRFGVARVHTGSHL